MNKEKMLISLKIGNTKKCSEDLFNILPSSYNSQNTLNLYHSKNQSQSLENYNNLDKNSKINCISSKAFILDNISKLQRKKELLDKILFKYFPENTSENQDQILNQISNIENKIYISKEKEEQLLSSDYTNFTQLTVFLTNLAKAKNHYSNSLNITKDEYKNLNECEKQNILENIRNNKYDIITNFKFNAGIEMDSNNPKDMNIMQRDKINIGIGNNNLENNYKLFRLISGNQNITDSQIAKFLNAKTPNVINAVDKYFQHSYKLGELTLYFSYEDTKYGRAHIKEVTHYFKFSASVEEMFNQVKVDCPRIGKIRMFSLKGTEIVANNPNIRCIGALKLLNKSLIKVIDKK